ncbi:Sec-independent protein translocase TatB, partial [Mycobacterium tuberculosis]|nr:Sec-independent protein translocase TatB [Mycobacterium tuberculosis]
HQASAPAHAPDPVADEQSASPADLQAEKTSATAAVPHSSPASSDKP